METWDKDVDDRKNVGFMSKQLPRNDYAKYLINRVDAFASKSETFRVGEVSMRLLLNEFY